jgi:hypothetical protein
MIYKYIKQFFAAFIVGCGLAATTACSSNEDPYFTAGEDDDPRILNTDIPEGSKGEPAVIQNIERTTNFKYEVMVTPVHYTTVTWFIDDELVAEGLTIDVPVLAGNHIVKIVATTTKGKTTSRTCRLTVRPADGDPTLADDPKSRWLTIGTSETIECTNATSVTKVYIGKQEAANVSFANGKLTFDVPTMEEGEYQLVIEDESGMRYGCGFFTVSLEQYVDPGIKETVLWKGSTEINWGDSNVTITPEQLAEVPVGATIQLYYELVDGAEYHALRITTPLWGDYAEDQVVAQFDLTADTPNPFEFTYTEANRAIVNERGGMLIVGFGYKLTKVVAVEGVAPAESKIWEGSVDINWGDSNVNISVDDMAAVPVGATVCLYYQMVDGAEYHALRITTPLWGDNAGDQVVAQFDITADTPNPFEFTYTEANKAIVNERGGMLIVGFGYKLTKVTWK